jgi:hypothetical protein
MNNKNKDHIQQGDVLFRRVERLPEGCKRRDNRTVALGEHTGHHHTFDDGVALMEAPDKRIFAVNESGEPKTLTHQEHNPVTVLPGEVYEFGQVREKNWFTEMVQAVRD